MPGTAATRFALAISPVAFALGSRMTALGAKRSFMRKQKIPPIKGAKIWMLMRDQISDLIDRVRPMKLSRNTTSERP